MSLNASKLPYEVTKWSQWITSQWVCSIKSRPSVAVGLFLLRVGSGWMGFFCRTRKRLLCFCFVLLFFTFFMLNSYLGKLICILLREINLYLWPRYSTILSFCFRSQFGKKIKGHDQQLVHCLGVNPEFKHRRRSDTDFTLLIGTQYSPQLCFDSVSPFCTIGSPLKAGLSPNFLLLVSG